MKTQEALPPLHCGGIGSGGWYHFLLKLNSDSRRDSRVGDAFDIGGKWEGEIFSKQKKILIFHPPLLNLQNNWQIDN